VSAKTAPRRRAKRGEGELLRERIVDATKTLLLRAKDVDAVSIRAVSYAVGVTPPSIYMHFSNKEELILEVCGRQFEAFDAFLAHAAEGIDDPVEVVNAMGRAYVRFGLDHPEEYRLLFMSPTPEWVMADRKIEDLSGFGRVLAAVQRCIDSGAFAQGDAFTVTCGLWASVHGLVSLLIAKPHFPWPPLDTLMEHGIQSHSRGLQST
jgi:AcrR family transcriptional regulator